MAGTRTETGTVSEGQELAITGLLAGDRVHLYGTVVLITGPWYVPGDGMPRGWGRLPMLWDGLSCAPPERGDTLVRLADEEESRAGDAPGAVGGRGDELHLRGGDHGGDRADDPAAESPPGPGAALAGASAVPGAYVIRDAPGLPAGTVIRVVPDEAQALYHPGALAGLREWLRAVIVNGRKQ